MESVFSADSRDEFVLKSSRFGTPGLDQSLSASNSSQMVFQTKSLHARPETGMSDIESVSTHELAKPDSIRSMTQSRESPDSMSRRSMFADSAASPSPSNKFEATKTRICRSPDDVDISLSRKIPHTTGARTPGGIHNVEYRPCLDDFIAQVPTLNLGIPTQLTHDDFLATKHFCNGSHSRIFKADMKVTSSPPTPAGDATTNGSQTSPTSSGRKVILKILSESSVQNEVAQKDFQVEIGILTRLYHPHLVNLLGYGSLKSKMGDEYSRSLIALECLLGDTLAYHLGLKRSFHVQPFTKLRYFRIAKEFADALNYIHTQVHPDYVLIHRDLKPDNVGFAQDGSLKIFDFGLCTVVRRRHTKSGTVSVSGTGDGTPPPGLTSDTYLLTGCTGSFRYMAPENALEKPYNESVDIYSYGIIMYEVITGVTPFKGMQRDEFFERVMRGGCRPGLDYDDYGRDTKMRPAVKQALTRCWDPDYTRRPSAAEMLALFADLEASKIEDYKKKGFLQKGINLFKKADSI